MRVYAETNFLMEMARHQECERSCIGIIELCETGRANIFIPSFSISESGETLAKLVEGRFKLRDRVNEELKQLSRSEVNRNAANSLKEVTTFLVRSNSTEIEGLFECLGRIQRIAHIIPLDDKIISDSLDYSHDYGLDIKDAIVYSSIVSHLRVNPPKEKCIFVDKNSKDFKDEEIRDELKGLGCDILFNFDSAYQRIKMVSFPTIDD